jgi:hypothetical protein
MNERYQRLNKLKEDLINRVQREFGNDVKWSHITSGTIDGHRSLKDLMGNNEIVINYIKRVFFNNSNISRERLLSKIPPSSKLKTKLNEAKQNMGKPLSDKYFGLYYAYIESLDIEKRQTFEFEGYYWSYLKNASSKKPFKLDLKYPVTPSINDKATVSATLTKFHEATISVSYSGFGYFSRANNKLFIELHNDNSPTIDDAVYLILSTSGDFSTLNRSILRGVLTGVSSGDTSRPILSMEVVLFGKDSKLELIPEAKSYLHLHKYSIRVRSKSLSDRFPVLSGKINTTRMIKNLFSSGFDLIYYRLGPDNKVRYGTLGFKKTQHQEFIIENHFFDENNDPKTTRCHYELEFNKGNIDMVITEYSSVKLRELRLKMRLRRDITKNKYIKKIGGTCIYYHLDKFYISLMVLYPVRQGLKDRGQMNFSEFFKKIEEKYGNEEVASLKSKLMNFYSRDIFEVLYPS